MSHERWLVSYADFMTLLFAFFAMMYAISSVDAMKLANVAHGFKIAFDESASGRAVMTGDGLMPEKGDRIVPLVESMDAVRTRIVHDLGLDFSRRRLELILDPRGLIISIPEASAFPVGSDDLSPAAQELIGRVASSLARVANPVRVEGHTDDVPIHTLRFPSNWDLSTARATRVVQYFIEQGQIAPDRLSAAGYAEFHPRTPNSTPAARATNRRVDVLVLNATTRIAEEPAMPAAPRP